MHKFRSSFKAKISEVSKSLVQLESQPVLELTEFEGSFIDPVIVF